MAIPIFKVSQGACPLARVFRAPPGRCLEALYPRGFRSLSDKKELEKREGGSAGTSSKRGSLKPAYLGHFQVGCSETLVKRASPDTLPENALFIRAPEVPARKALLHAGFRACSFAHTVTTENPKTP